MFNDLCPGKVSCTFQHRWYLFVKKQIKVREHTKDLSYRDTTNASIFERFTISDFDINRKFESAGQSLQPFPNAYLQFDSEIYCDDKYQL
jgi:hypothetical protein